ncbi:hypothetical protein D3H55_17270 [Bacillus salacetis]|uniref:Uncharacterized protein n=1 Tax=Bacillus salacetis TaxID=2315464 RepID=A0A3A1QSD6_9BACI|nr:hypothetical protein [Bacillus salacetis]RIW30195.1 hypothetical protein D3H55_17270 [Bacillus salacetis]
MRWNGGRAPGTRQIREIMMNKPFIETDMATMKGQSHNRHYFIKSTILKKISFHPRKCILFSVFNSNRKRVYVYSRAGNEMKSEVSIMGYIAPVPHYQYMQYAEREISKDYDPFTFMPVTRIRPLVNKDQQYDGSLSDGNIEKFGNRKRSSKSEHISSEFLADITGKGKYVNEYV